jgi:hypothetical protein
MELISGIWLYKLNEQVLINTLEDNIAKTFVDRNSLNDIFIVEYLLNFY